MMKNARFRLSADPTIGVADLMGPLEKYMTMKGDRNILTMVRPPSGVTQKTAPDPLWLNKNFALYMEYAKVAPNSMIPPKKHRTALERLDCQTKCNFTKSSSEDWADQVDSAIRLAMKQFRDLKKDVVQRERAFRRIDSVVQKNIQRVLDYLTKVDKESHFDDEDSQNAAEDKAAATPKDTILAIMDGPDPTHKEPLEKKKTLSPSKLFQKILEQQTEPEDLETEERTRPLPATSSKEAHEEDRPALRKLQPFFSPVTIDAKEESMINDAQNMGPIADIRKKKSKKKKKDDKDNKTAKPKAKPKGKPKGKAKAKEKKKTTQKVTKKEEAQVTKKEEAKVTKKEEAKVTIKEEAKVTIKEEAKVDKKEAKVTKKEAKVAKKHTVEWEKEPEPVVREKWFDGMLDMVEEGRKKAKHRIESRAHHSEENKWKRLSGQFTDEDHQEFSRRRKLARDLCKKEFDRRWPDGQDKPYDSVEPMDLEWPLQLLCCVGDTAKRCWPSVCVCDWKPF